MVWGNDREMMTSDAGGGVYYGGVASYDGAKLSLALSETADGTQPGGGQYTKQSAGACDFCV